MRIFKFLARRLKEPEVRDQIFRIISLALILIAVGACVVLVLAFMMHLEVLLVAFSGVLVMALAFALFIRLWPRELEQETKKGVGEKIADALKKPEPKPLSPVEYRRQRELAQKMIREKAAPALAKAIRGYLLQDRQQQGKKRKRGRRGRK